MTVWPLRQPYNGSHSPDDNGAQSVTLL
eukprot:SAG22_NODE_16626_length_321_cov_0.923423_2_plen_27_part_01